MYPFEKLVVWQEAHAIAVELYALTAPWRDWDLRNQLRRCASSVAANIAEGAGCESQASFARFVAIAQASASELRYHLLYARDVGLLPASDFSRIDPHVQSVRRMLVRLHRRILHPEDATNAEGRPRIAGAPRIPQ